MGGSKERTTVGLQVERLVDAPEKAYKASMREAYKNVGSGMKSVMRTYQRNIIDSKSLFNDGYLNALGYNPGEDIKYRAVDPVLVLSWCKNNISSSVSSVSSYRWGIPTIEEIAIEFLQDTYGVVNFAENSLSIDNVKWFVSGVTVTSATSSDATLLKNSTTTVAEYASSLGTNVISIDEGVISENGFNYWRATLGVGIRLVPVVYMTVACPGISSDVVPAILADYDGKEFYVVQYGEDEEIIWENTIVISAYIKDDGDIGVTGKFRRPVIADGWTSRIYVEATQDAMRDKIAYVYSDINTRLADSLDRLVVKYVLSGITKLKLAEIDKELVSSEANSKAFPVIPLKENYAMVNGSNYMKAMLNKLGMATSDFEESLADTRLKNAAIMFIVDLNDDSEAGVKLIFETLINMVKTTVPAAGKIAAHEAYQLTVGYSDIDMKTTINMDIVTASGVVAEVGKYVRYTYDYTYEEIDPESNVTTTKVATKIGIKKQVTAEYYQQMEFGDCNTKWKIGGYELGGRLGRGASEDANNVYLPISDIGLDTLNYEESTYVIALSMSLVLTSVVTTKTKWYQSGFFKFILIVALVALTIITFGTTSAYTVPTIGFLLGVEVATAATIFTVIVVVTTTISVLGILGVDTGIFGTAAMVVGLGLGAATSYMTAGNMTVQQTVLATAKTLTSLASMAVDINTEGIARSIESKMSALAKELEASEDQLKDIANQTQQGLWMGIQDRTPDMLYAMSSTAAMCNYDILYDYDGMYEGKISSIGI